MCLINSASQHEDVYGRGGIALPLTSVLDRGCSASRPGRLTLLGKKIRYHLYMRLGEAQNQQAGKRNQLCIP
jgi:hypothetical protein